MTFISQDNQNLLWELIAESGLLHTVSDRIPMVQQQFQGNLMKYQFSDITLTEKNKLVIQEMITYIKSVQEKKDTNESLQNERINTLQENMNAHEAHFKQYALPKKVQEIDFSDPKPDPNSYTPIQQVLNSQQLERNADNKIDTILKELQEMKDMMNIIIDFVNNKNKENETIKEKEITFTTNDFV